MIDRTATLPFNSLLSSVNTNSGGDKRMSAAKDFEALLLSQMIHTMRESGSGWMGSDGDQAMDSAMGLAEEQFGRALVAGGGLGLARFVASGFKPEAAPQDTPASASTKTKGQ